MLCKTVPSFKSFLAQAGKEKSTTKSAESVSFLGGPKNAPNTYDSPVSALSSARSRSASTMASLRATCEQTLDQIKFQLKANARLSHFAHCSNLYFEFTHKKF